MVSKSKSGKTKTAAEGNKAPAGPNVNAEARSSPETDDIEIKDEWLLRFEVNERGIGHLLLPPSLSILLQSDRVSIVPSAGGLFIRSV